MLCNNVIYKCYKCNKYKHVCIYDPLINVVSQWLSELRATAVTMSKQRIKGKESQVIVSLVAFRKPTELPCWSRLQK